MSLKDENRDKTVEGDLVKNTHTHTTQKIYLLNPFSISPVPGSAGRDAEAEGRVRADTLTGLTEPQTPTLGLSAPK